MGRTRHRVNPRVRAKVNRDLDRQLQSVLSSVVRGLPPPWEPKPRGRRPHDPRTVVICCMLMVALRRTYDSIESYLRQSDHLRLLFHTDHLPGHSVIHRGMTRLPPQYILKVQRKVIWRFRRAGMTVALDSSGMSTTNRSVWFDIRIGRKSSRRECIKLHIAIDVATGLVLHFTMTAWNKGDSPQLKRLMGALPRIARALGDTAYSSRRNCEIVARKGGKAYFLFRNDATGRAHAHPEWRRSFLELVQDPDGWKAIYHLRSIVEAVFSSLKRTWGSALRSRKRRMQRKELALKVLAYDVRQALYNAEAQELGVGLRVKVA
jgi:transposase